MTYISFISLKNCHHQKNSRLLLLLLLYQLPALSTKSNQTTNMATSDRVLRRVATARTTNDTAAILQPLQKQLHNYLDPSKYYVLVEFAVRHLDFQIAELVSVLNMHHIDVMNHNDTDQATKRDDDSACCCTLIPLPNDDQYPSHRHQTYSKSSTTTSPTDNDNGRNRQGHNFSTGTRPFAILSMDYGSPFVPLDAKINSLNSTEYQNNHDDRKDIASIILSRCTLVRSVIELWGMATSVHECAQVTKRQCVVPQSTTTTTNVRNVLYQIQSVPAKSWKMTIHTLGSTYTREDQDAMRHEFTLQLPFHGTVQMKDPNNEFVVIREIELDSNGSPKLQQQSRIPNNERNGATAMDEISSHDECSKSQPNLPQETNATDRPHGSDQSPSIACYFGRALGGCRSVRRMGGNIPRYDLKQRKYLGPTSMDAELSFIMTNLGHVQPGHLVFDPFVGTGSILLSCATRGAYCVGTDIDIRVLRGRSNDENIFSNFRQFHLPRPELIRSDNGIYHRHFRPSHPPIYNAIVCDPPYGIRAGARKSGSKREHVVEVKPENRHDHIAQTQTYAVSDVLADLVDVAARTLVMHGRLVYVIPSFATSFDAEVDLPQHPCLELVHVCYQPLSTELGRRIVAMKKTSNYDETKRDEYLQMVWKNGPASADKCANIRAKIIEMAKTKPRYDERAAIRKEKRRLHREEKKVSKRK